ncbi:MAG: hypothetical protein GW859_02135 [Sphingomonadales bacterium]|nr:hypothetical protein [Sphingomonadales bacterium]
MTKLDNTNFYIFDKSQEAALDGLLSDMEGAGPIVPTDCGPMVRITDEKDAKFLEQALA